MAAGLCVEEANAIEESIREEAERRKSGTGEKLGWLDLFRGSNLRRTSIATMGGSLKLFQPCLFNSDGNYSVVFAFQQLTGTIGV